MAALGIEKSQVAFICLDFLRLPRGKVLVQTCMFGKIMLRDGRPETSEAPKKCILWQDYRSVWRHYFGSRDTLASNPKGLTYQSTGPAEEATQAGDFKCN